MPTTGARTVRVQVDSERFLFEHDGHDFKGDEFRSLCSFGYSNKRSLYTIGFRGIGFKSTFSLGDAVEVLTPTLAVRFHKKRFTLPEWVGEAPPSTTTQISVRFSQPEVHQELEKNLREWSTHPVSLVFFRHIERLVINETEIHLDRLGPGPAPGSERIRLPAAANEELLLISSEELPFPENAEQEIRDERNEEGYQVPACRVQIVLGLKDPQRLFVVLPTEVTPPLPFSCNAPFLQDPARNKIKALSGSPTNRWLLERIGRLAAEAMMHWLANQGLPLQERARAYDLLPEPPQPRDSLAADVAEAVYRGMRASLEGQHMVLTADGRLVGPKSCLAPPQVVYEVWSPVQIQRVFAQAAGNEHVLAAEVSGRQRSMLQEWEQIELLSSDDLARALETNASIPRSDSHSQLLRLWQWADDHGSRKFGKEKLKRCHLVPVGGRDTLHPATSAVRLPERAAHITEAAWEFLTQLLPLVDPEWIDYLSAAKERAAEDQRLQAAQRLLETLELSSASKADTIAKSACQQLFSRSEVSLEEHVRIAHLIVGLGAAAPDTLRAVTRDGRSHPWYSESSPPLISGDDPWVEELLPKEWQQTKVLHDAYYRDFEGCSR
ncbi:MAG: hypothetical protein N3C12_00940 [Candidatus Binatia bacterium]|nr:hypothetical protein [Candidatus Binatia bacterium]